MVFKRRTYQKLISQLKKCLAVFLAAFIIIMPVCAYSAGISDSRIRIASNSKNAAEVLKGSVSVDIVPYCDNWTSQYALAQINRIGTRLIQANNIEQNIRFVVSENSEANA